MTETSRNSCPGPAGGVPCREAFARAVDLPDPQINLAEAALLIAQEEYPHLDIAAYLAQLDRMAEAARARLAGVAEPRRIIAGLNAYLFQAEGLRGNTEAYHDPRNSFLNEVLERRTGIPITLSVVYLEISRRLGLPLVGVGMPGHFLVKYPGEEEIVLDPFNGGALVAPEDCQRILDRLYEGAVRFHPRFLAAVTSRQILARMLQNLKGIYVRAEQYAKGLAAVERLLLLYPDAPAEVRDRGLLACQLKRYAQASADLARYLRLSPEAEDRDVIRDHLCSLRQRLVTLN